jgi:cation transport ATPase
MRKFSLVLKVISMMWGCILTLYCVMGTFGMSPGGEIHDPLVQFAAFIAAVAGAIYFFPNSYITQTKRRVFFFKIAYALPIILIVALTLVSFIINGYERFIDDEIPIISSVMVMLFSTPLLSLKYYQ